LLRTFGSGAMTNSIADVAQAKCFFAIGTNTSANHPVIGARIREAVLGGAKLIVANPYQIPMVKYADLFLQHRPGTDLALLMGMARVIVDQRLHDEKFIEERCENFDVFRASLQPYDLDFVEQVTGVPADKISEAACMYASQKPAAILYAMGITQHTHGTDNVMAVGDLAMLTGNIGRPGGGVNPLRGQNNVQGACDMGALPNVFTGYQVVTDGAIRGKFEAAWNVKLPDKVGRTLPEMFDAIDRGEIKAVYLIGENPVLSEPDLDHARKCLDKLEFLVCQDIFLSETALSADIVLPAAAAMEREGTFTNTERRVQWLNQVVDPPGEAKPDWWIACQVARRMGAPGFDFDSAAAVLAEINTLTPSYGGITPERLQTQSLQWPCPDPGHAGTSILHQDRFTRGKGYFVPIVYQGPMELPDDDYPFVLTTARSLFHYHTGTMTRKIGGLNQLRDREWLEMHASDAERLGVETGETVRITSRRGSVQACVRANTQLIPGVVAMDFHFAESPVNALTNPAHDPISKIPEYKVCAVRIDKLAAREKPQQALAM
jgi:formate dehydrogenase (NADP+) alpha subunit